MDKEAAKKFYVYRQLPTPIFVGHVKVSLDAKGDALAMFETSVADRLFRARVEWMGADGLLISGFEEADKFLPDGRAVMRYQEWFCRYEFGQ